MAFSFHISRRHSLIFQYYEMTLGKILVLWKLRIANYVINEPLNKVFFVSEIPFYSHKTQVRVRIRPASDQKYLGNVPLSQIFGAKTYILLIEIEIRPMVYNLAKFNLN